MESSSGISFDKHVLRWYFVCCCFLILKMSFMSIFTAVKRVIHKAFANPEDSKQMKVDPQVNENVERVRRAHLNDLENIPLFFVAGLIYTFANPGAAGAKAIFVIYVVTRYLHTFVYTVVPLPQPARALSWSTGYIINIYMAMYSLIHFLKSSSV
ncbi:microsomal glutathione S-transferase 1 [Diabrotica virgifera virgifera]|uniref:Microsomal glutathione S-transferase 1 n=1 Tax=Diabrotica virgifera virgifera TaxID=50390 RepID=A0A6P7GTW7_DIAVI|nr:microsomal glutathione S-transferase 1 [Diabrotica virgifera virgifera]